MTKPVTKDIETDMDSRHPASDEPEQNLTEDEPEEGQVDDQDTDEKFPLAQRL